MEKKDKEREEFVEDWTSIGCHCLILESAWALVILQDIGIPVLERGGVMWEGMMEEAREKV
jgi:hypothetical protein